MVNKTPLCFADELVSADTTATIVVRVVAERLNTGRLTSFMLW